MRQTKG